MAIRIIQNPSYKEEYSRWAISTGEFRSRDMVPYMVSGWESVPPTPIIIKEKSRMQLALEKQQEYMEYGIRESEAIRKLSQDMINFYDGENSHLIENTLTRLHDVSQKFGIARGLIPTLSRWTGLKFEYNISDKDIKSDKDAINLVINELTKNIQKLKVDVGNIDNLTVTLQEYFEDVDKLIVKVKQEMANVKIETYDSAIEEGFRQDKLEQLEQKIADLYETKETTVMLSKQLRMIRKNNLDLYSMLHSRIATRVPTLLASVAVKSIMDRSKRTINHIEGFDKGSDKLLLANNKEISSNLIRTSKRKTEALVERRKTIETIKAEIVHTALELKTLHQINAEKRLTIMQDMDAGFEDEIKLLTTVATNPTIKIETLEKEYIDVEVESVNVTGKKVARKRKAKSTIVLMGERENPGTGRTGTGPR